MCQVGTANAGEGKVELKKGRYTDTHIQYTDTQIHIIHIIHIINSLDGCSRSLPQTQCANAGEGEVELKRQIHRYIWDRIRIRILLGFVNLTEFEYKYYLVMTNQTNTNTNTNIIQETTFINLITPQNMGKLTSETIFGHLKVFFWPLLRTKRSFSQNPPMSRFWKFRVFSHHPDIPKNHEASYGTFFFRRTTFSSHVFSD